MTKIELIAKYYELGYKSKSEIARSLGITPQCFNNWKPELSRHSMDTVIASFLRQGKKVPKEFL